MRKAIPTKTETQVLHLSRRRCCVCFALNNDFGTKKGQIAHLDGKHSQNRLDNLAFLCLEHHDEYDSTSSQSKGLKRSEVVGYRDSLYQAVGEFLYSARLSSEGESLLGATGELDYYLATFDSAQTAGVMGLQRVGEATVSLSRRLKAANEVAVKELQSGRASPTGYRRWEDQVATALNDFARDVRHEVKHVSDSARRLLDSLSRAAAVGSDIEQAPIAIFQQKLEDLAHLRHALIKGRDAALATGHEVRNLQRGSTKLNRGRRLFFAVLGEFAGMVGDQLSEVERHEQHLRTVISLL